MLSVKILTITQKKKKRQTTCNTGLYCGNRPIHRNEIFVEVARDKRTLMCNQKIFDYFEERKKTNTFKGVGISNENIDVITTNAQRE